MAIAPGWYDDGSGIQRWWDGTQWTAHQAPAQPAPQQAQPQSQASAQPAVQEQFAAAPGQQPAGQYGGGAQQQYSQQPAYGAYVAAPGAPGAPSAKKPRTGLIIGLVAGGLVLLLLSVALIWWLVSASRPNPEEALANYITSLEQADCELLRDTTTEAYRGETFLEDCEALDEVSDENWNADWTFEYTVVESEVDGDNATLELEATTAFKPTGESHDADITVGMVFEDGKWRVNSFDFDE